MWLDLQLANLASHTETQSARLLKTALMLPSTRQQLQQQQREGLVLPYYCPETGGQGTGDWGQLVLVVIHKDAKSFHKQNTFFSVFFLRRIARATELRCGGGGVARYTTRGRSVCMCVRVCLGFLVITLITRETQQCMMKCFQKYNLSSLSHTLSLSLCLSRTVLPFLVRPAQNFKKFLHTQDFMLLLLLLSLFFASYK